MSFFSLNTSSARSSQSPGVNRRRSQNTRGTAAAGVHEFVLFQYRSPPSRRIRAQTSRRLSTAAADTTRHPSLCTFLVIPSGCLLRSPRRQNQQVVPAASPGAAAVEEPPDFSRTSRDAHVPTSGIGPMRPGIRTPHARRKVLHVDAPPFHDEINPQTKTPTFTKCEGGRYRTNRIVLWSTPFPTFSSTHARALAWPHCEGHKAVG